MIDPGQFIITRKRKKYRFAQFANSPLCFEMSEWKKRKVDVVEVGAGTALFLVEQATRDPSKQFLAVDIKADRLQKGAKLASDRELGNITFLRARVDQLADVIDTASVDTIWVTFPDPFLKDRAAKHRLTHPNYLSIYATVLSLNGSLCFKTDARALFDWSLEQFVKNGWRINQLSFDLHQSGHTDAYRIMTTYETRFTREGLPIYFVRVSPDAVATPV